MEFGEDFLVAEVVLRGLAGVAPTEEPAATRDQEGAGKREEGRIWAELAGRPAAQHWATEIRKDFQDARLEAVGKLVKPLVQ